MNFKSIKNWEGRVAFKLYEAKMLEKCFFPFSNSSFKTFQEARIFYIFFVSKPKFLETRKI